ncbi:hypothetical protein C0995_010473 [Termitomyces sp. Mi166|nr:hypothetical protein C0995_010473 [Termitomyces sp. Mi166\
MFSVKVTYHGEIRRFSFPNSTTFPTYEQLYSQLTRVFSSSNNYYLSKLLFFPDASQPGRILIGNQVRNAEDYNRCLVAFAGRTWLNASLRFTLVDGNTDMGSRVFISQTAGQLPWAGAPDGVPNSVDTASRSTSNPRPLFAPRSPVTFAVPPRAVSHIPSDSEPLMDMSNNILSASSLTSYGSSPPNRASDAAASCCSTAQVKKDVESLLREFQRDLNQAMGRLSGLTTPNVDHPSANTTPSQFGVLNAIFTIPPALSLVFDMLSDWLSSHSPFIPPLPQFLDVNFPALSGPTPPSFTTPVRTPPPPPVIHRDYDLCTPCIVNGAHERHNPRHQLLDISEPGRVVVRTINQPEDTCNAAIVGIRYKCMHPDCPDFDLCERCEALPIPQHPETHPFLKMRSVETTIPTVCRSTAAMRSSPHNMSMSPWIFNQTPIEERTVRPHSPSVHSTILSDSELSPMRLLHDNPSVPSFASPRTPPVLEVNCPPSDAQSDSISRSLYPLSDQPPLIEPWPLSMSNTFIHEEVATFVSPSSALSSALPDVNDTPVVPESWYSTSLNSLINHPADELNTPHSVSEVLTQTPQESTRTYSPHHIEEAIDRPPTPHLAEMREICPPLAELLTVHHSMSSLSLEDRAEERTPSSLAANVETPLSAGYVADITTPNGQTLAAGAIFIKIWRMVNNGTHDWPPNTEVVFVGGAQLTNGNPLLHIQPMCPVGPLKPGQKKNVWTPELKAPDVPGRYTSYWRLRDGKGRLFGDSIWVDIEVVDPSQSEESVTSSSMIIMPDPTSPPSLVADERTVSTVDIEDSSDDYFSDSSSVSIVSMSSEDEADATLWEESRAHGRAISTEIRVEASVHHPAEHASTAMDYVLLYDDNTSEEE